MKSASGERLTIGVAGIDEILHGGLLPGRAYLVRGGPGTGKTTLGLHFITHGAKCGETALFISLEEPERHVRSNAEALGFDLSRVAFLDLSPDADFFAKNQSYDIFSPAEVEREPTTRKITEQVEALQPKRVFLEMMTEFRYLTTDQFQFRKQVLSFLLFLTEHGATVLLSSESSTLAPDDDLQFMADGVINLEVNDVSRTVGVTKFRGSEYHGGTHAMRLTGHGMEVYPRLMPSVHRRRFFPEQISSGQRELDALLGGGIERGTTTIIAGPTGVGKTTLGMQLLMQASRQQERAVVYAFEESIETLLLRSERIGMPLRNLLERGHLAVVQVEPLRYSPDEFAKLVRNEIEQRHATSVMIDSVSGYHLSMHGVEAQGKQDALVSNLHALSKYLRNMGVAGFFINEVENISGDFRATQSGISYLTDNIVFLRYVEMHSEIRRCIGVLKKRLSSYEHSMREFDITSRGIRIGEVLRGVRCILTGNPEWTEMPVGFG